MAIHTSKTKSENKDDFSYEVIEKLGVISERGKTKLELRYISWNNGEPKYDIRPWYEKDGEERMQKGISLSGEELIELAKIIQKEAKGK